MKILQQKHNMIDILIFAGSLILKFASAQDPNLHYFCTDEVGSNYWKMEVFVRKNAGQMTGLVGVDVNTGEEKTLSCDETPVILSPIPINPMQEVTGDGTDSNPFRITLTISKLTQTPNPPCGAFVANNIAHAQFKPKADVATAWTVPHNLTCDLTNAAQTQTNNVMSVVTINQRSVTVVNIGEPLVLTVLNINKQAVTTITTEHVYLQAQFFSGPGIYSPVSNATGISPHSCKICDTKDCTGGLVTNLTDFNGCPVDNVVMSTGLTGDGVTLTSSLITVSSLFNYSFIHFTCSDDYCTADTGLGKCQNRCGTVGKRKKRDIDLNDEVYTFTKEYYSQPVLCKPTNMDPNIIEHPGDCSTGNGFKVATGTMSVIFITTTVISLVQFFRLVNHIKEIPRNTLP